MQQQILPYVNDAEFPARLEAELLQVIQEQSSDLQPKYQSIDWTTAAAAEKLNQAIAPRLQTFDNRAAAVQWLQTTLLPKLFRADFLASEQPHNLHTALWTRLCPDESDKPVAPVDDPKPAAETEIQAEATEVSEPSGIAVLLLDAENLQLKAEEESFLQQNCPHPIQVKLAFANWRKLGKLDETLHSRSYDLIHVPSGKDHADGKMIAMGTAIHERYPQTRAVLICSSDSIMTSLHSQLAKNKIKAYQVVRANQGLTLSSGFNGDREEIVLPKPMRFSLDQAIAHLEAMVVAECKQTKTPIARLTQVAAQFLAQHQLSLKEVALHYQAGDKARQLVEAYPEKFKLHKLGQPPEWFIEPIQEQQFAITPSSTSATTPKTASANATTPQSQLSPLLQSSESLKSALVQCLQQQISEAQPEINVSVLAARFRQLYGEPISTALKRLKLGKKLIIFLSSQSDFEVSKKDGMWWVGLAPN